ncbi:3-deoxy-D-manno-octulosonic-acid transferase [Klebsormidium nitens]|uniref:lipid IVA 3-deoxy-D-manno-octulosonic acid transferase n=1 Tax=Klebsormidium nitens TaxID=105231 RepID=A0A1Y1HSL0_KLENI|nr:3-deoxy-D-manno-octulosonic-acid transferase [Klebsormidium nitens]|eukprot:GAQ79981.1 3-deoxy-D-manno-octulosonic-acid transferase [Klebsormidium nitens]
MADTLQLQVYQILGRLFSPVVPKVWTEDECLRQRLGHASVERPPGLLIWIHGVSLGETLAALPLAEHCLAAIPSAHVLMTTVTQAGMDLLRRRRPERASCQFLPLDTPQAVGRFWSHWRPDAGIFLEGELWPTLIHTAQANKCPLVFVNARMGPRSFRRWSYPFLRPLVREMLQRFHVICPIDTHEAIRLQLLGASAGQIRFAGDLKYASAGYAVSPPATDEPIRAAAGRPIWIASSTHEGEEEVICSVHLQLSPTLPALLTVLAPRHPARCATVAAMLQRAGLTVARRSLGAAITPKVNVYLVDTLGELATLYALAPVAFVGGSLFPHLAGHNLAEPAASGCALLTGPHVGHFQGMVRELGDAVQQLADAGELSSALQTLFSNSLLLKARRNTSRETFQRLSAQIIQRVWANIAPSLFGPDVHLDESPITSELRI